MAFLDTTATATYVWVVGLACIAAMGVATVAIGLTLRETRRERLARQESVRTYYGHLVLAH